MKKLDDELLKQLALDAVRYQDFKSKCVLDRLSYRIGKSSVKLYLDAGARYIKKSRKHDGLRQEFFKYIDEHIGNYVQPLRPQKHEKRELYNMDYTNKETKSPIVYMVESNRPLTETFLYGIKNGNTIRLFESEITMKMFMEGVKFSNPNHECECGTVVFEKL